MARSVLASLPALGLSAAVALGGLGCSGETNSSRDAGSGSAAGGAAGAGPSGSTGSGPSAGPTFHADVEPILQKRCLSCHAPGKIAPFSLVTYDEAAPLAGLLAEVVASGAMPPWSARETAECKPRFGFKDDPRPTADEIATLEAWAAAGAPRGDPAEAPPAFVPPPDGLPGVELEVVPKTPYVTSGDTDQFRCFVMDPELEEDVFVNGMHVIAGNPEVVHHALVYVDTERTAAKLADADGGYDCFGGPNLGGVQLLAGWAPGGAPVELEPHIGAFVPKGSLLVMQVHYHPGGKTAAPDATRFQMRFTKQKPEYAYLVALIGNFDKPVNEEGTGLLPGPNDEGGVAFRIPANAKDHVESMQFTVPDVGKEGLLVYGAASHMHYVGTDMKIDLDRAKPAASEPASECLLQTPEWDFSWQRFYPYEAKTEDLPRIRTGDVLKLRCTYDNTIQNPFVAAALDELGLPAPVDVYLGEQTLDEMCLVGLPLLIKLD